MQNPKPITVFAANCRGNPANCLYPHRIEIVDENSAAEAFSWDIVCAEYRNNYRSVENFLTSNALPMDCDNDHSNHPDLWITAEDIGAFFPDVTYLIHYSRHHMKPKGDKSARPRFHVVFLIDPITDPEAYVRLKQRVAEVFPFFDSNAMDAALVNLLFVGFETELQCFLCHVGVKHGYLRVYYFVVFNDVFHTPPKRQSIVPLGVRVFS